MFEAITKELLAYAFNCLHIPCAASVIRFDRERSAVIILSVIWSRDKRREVGTTLRLEATTELNGERATGEFCQVMAMVWYFRSSNLDWIGLGWNGMEWNVGCSCYFFCIIDFELNGVSCVVDSFVFFKLKSFFYMYIFWDKNED